MNEPDVVLDFKQVFCNRHGEPFRAHWPTGYAAFVLAAFDLFLKSHEATSTGSVKEAVKLLDRRPICCRLEPQILLTVYRKVAAKDEALWPIAECDLCGSAELTMEIGVMGKEGVSEKKTCLGCVAGVSKRLGSS